jgi:hypothetical protein
MPASTRLARCSAGWIVAVAADERGRYGAARNTIDRTLSGSRNILSTGTTVTGEPIRYPSGAPALLTAVEIAEGSWGTTNTSLTTMARLRLCRTATEQAFQRGTLEDSSLVF